MSTKKVGIDTKYISKAELEDLQKVMRDPFEFAKHIYVVNPVHGKVRFDLYPYQLRLLYDFLTKRFNIVLKFRQAGITELISLYCLWLAMYHANKNIIILSIKERVAKKVLRKIKYMYRNLPAHLQVPIVNGRTGELGTGSEMEFANNSFISSLATTEDAARSEGLSLLVIDEAAIIRWADQIWAAAWPTLSTGGNAIVNSTPYGVGNWYHELWVDACSGGNSFNAVRLHWQMHPERDQSWYDLQREALGPRRTAQEIDGDFLTSGNNVFDLLDIRSIEEGLADHLPILLEEHGNLRIFEEPQTGKRYYIGADVATGRSRDYSSFTLMDQYGEECAVYKGKISTSRFAELLYRVGKKYNNALVAPEANDIGLSTVIKLQDMNYPNLYYSTKMVKQKGEKRPREEKIPGWLTTSKNRPIIIDELEEDIRNDNVVIKDPYFVQEAYTFIYDESNKPIAMGKKGRRGAGGDEDSDRVYTDDSIMGKAICNHIRKSKKSGIIVVPQ